MSISTSPAAPVEADEARPAQPRRPGGRPKGTTRPRRPGSAPFAYQLRAVFLDGRERIVLRKSRRRSLEKAIGELTRSKKYKSVHHVSNLDESEYAALLPLYPANRTANRTANRERKPTPALPEAPRVVAWEVLILEGGTTRTVLLPARTEAQAEFQAGLLEGALAASPIRPLTAEEYRQATAAV